MTQAPTEEPASGRTAEPGGRLAADSVWVFGAQMFAMVLRYVSAVFVTRALGVSWFGSYTVGLTLVTVVRIVATLGVSPGALPLLARARRAGSAEQVRATVRATWVVVGGAALAATVLVWACAPWLGAEVFDDAVLGGILRGLSLFVLFSAWGTATACLVQGLIGAREQALVERVVVTGVTAAGLGLSWWLGWGIRGAVAATVAGPLVGLVLSAILVARRVPGALGRGAPCAPLPLRALAGESWPLMGVNLFAFVLLFMDVLLMGVFRSPDEVGVYGACARLAPLVLVLHQAAGPVLLARVSVLFEDKNWDAIRSLYRVTGRWSLWSGAVVAAVFLVWRAELLALFGLEFVAGTSILAVLTLGRLAPAAAGMCGRLLSLTGKARVNMANMVLLVTCNGVLDVLWIPRHGGMGAALATCLSLTVVTLLQALEVWSFFRIHPFTTRSLLGVAGVVLLALLAHAWMLGPGADDGAGDGASWIVPLAAFLLASGGLYLVAGADDEDRAFLRSIGRRVRG